MIIFSVALVDLSFYFHWTKFRFSFRNSEANSVRKLLVSVILAGGIIIEMENSSLIVLFSISDCISDTLVNIVASRSSFGRGQVSGLPHIP